MADKPDVFADMKVRQEQLLRQLQAAPVVDVLGVVSASGASCGRFHGQELWTLKLALESWRVNRDAVQTRPLTVLREGTHKELKNLMDRIVPYTVVRLKGRVVPESSFGGPQGLLEALLGIESSDVELNHHAEQLQKPVTCEDPVFGTLTLDRRIDQFTGDGIWGGQPVSLAISAREPDEVQQALAAAHSLWASQDRWNRRIRDFGTKELLAVKNANWLDEEDTELTPDQFKSRMTLEAITVYPDGSFEFWHNDGDLFGGHSIQIGGSLTDGPTDAGIHG